MNTAEKESLLKEWIKFKKAEDAAKKKRVDVETQIEALYAPLIDAQEKSKTFSEDDLGFKVNLKKNIVRKLDQDKYISVRQDIPEDLRPEKITFSLDEKGFEFLKENKPEIYRMVSDCVEEKTNKTTVKVEKM